MTKYSKWLSKQPETKNDVSKYMNKSMIKNLLTKEIVKRKRLSKFNNPTKQDMRKRQARHSSMEAKMPTKYVIHSILTVCYRKPSMLKDNKIEPESVSLTIILHHIGKLKLSHAYSQPTVYKLKNRESILCEVK